MNTDKLIRTRLRETLRQELDWVVMKALEKDRTRRYETANAFARDIERYLHDQILEACPPSRMYRFGEFARRNRIILSCVVCRDAGSHDGRGVGHVASNRRHAGAAGNGATATDRLRKL